MTGPAAAGVACPTFLRLRRVRDAVVVARPELDDWSGGAGVIARGGGRQRVIQHAGLRRYGREQIPPPELEGWPIGDRIRAGVYAGFLYDHYGHFLLESLARLWAPEPRPSIPVIWIAGWTESFSPWMTDTLDLLGVGADRRIVTAASGPLEVGELIVADPGFEFGRFAHRWWMQRLGRVRPTTPPPLDPPTTDARALDSRPRDRSGLAGEHLWLSRSARVPISGLDEELEVEDHLRAHGWTILRPETLSMKEQVTRLANAAHIAGIEGSAFHTLALIDQPHAAIDLFTRQDHRNFDLLAATAGWDQQRHELPGATGRVRPKRRGTDMQWSGVDIPALADVLHRRCCDHGHPRPDAGANPGLESPMS